MALAAQPVLACPECSRQTRILFDGVCAPCDYDRRMVPPAIEPKPEQRESAVNEAVNESVAVEAQPITLREVVLAAVKEHGSAAPDQMVAMGERMGLSSTSPRGSLTAVASKLYRDGLLLRDGDGRYSLAPEGTPPVNLVEEAPTLPEPDPEQATAEDDFADYCQRIVWMEYGFTLTIRTDIDSLNCSWRDLDFVRALRALIDAYGRGASPRYQGVTASEAHIGWRAD